MACDELANKLAKRNKIIVNDEEGLEPELPAFKIFNPYTEFKEFSVEEIKNYQNSFKKYDLNNNNYLDLNELKVMMEKFGIPQTHLALKSMINEVDEDKDGEINFREFLLIFRKAMAGELHEGSGLYEIYRNLNEINVDEEGVKGAKNFFEAKVDELKRSTHAEAEIFALQEKKRQEEEEAKARKAAFKEKSAQFNR